MSQFEPEEKAPEEKSPKALLCMVTTDSGAVVGTVQVLEQSSIKMLSSVSAVCKLMSECGWENKIDFSIITDLQDKVMTGKALLKSVDLTQVVPVLDLLIVST